MCAGRGHSGGASGAVSPADAAGGIRSPHSNPSPRRLGGMRVSPAPRAPPDADENPGRAGGGGSANGSGPSGWRGSPRAALPGAGVFCLLGCLCTVQCAVTAVALCTARALSVCSVTLQPMKHHHPASLGSWRLSLCASHASLVGPLAFSLLALSTRLSRHRCSRFLSSKTPRECAQYRLASFLPTLLAGFPCLAIVPRAQSTSASPLPVAQQSSVQQAAHRIGCAAAWTGSPPKRAHPPVERALQAHCGNGSATWVRARLLNG
jgi:hypothetical protein